MQYPKSFLDELKTRTLLSSVIGRKIKITRKGREYSACCPFHKEKTPSFTINDEKGFYHCFGCGAHGDAISFLTEHDHLQFNEAVEYLAGLAGLAVPELSPQMQKQQAQSQDVAAVIEETAQFFTDRLKSAEGDGALQYLKSRGLTDATILKFRLGFAPDDPEALYKYLKLKKFADDIIFASTVVKPSQHQADRAYAFFRNRLMFPVCDLKGRPVAFGGRVLPPQFSKVALQGDPPKYINSPENPIFHKGRMVYAHHFARGKINAQNQALVVEGYMDVIALHQAGFETAVAPLGTALTETQIQELWRFAPEDAREPILCFDGDNAGKRAAVRALDRLIPILKAGHSARFAFLPDGLDPDDMIKSRGVSAFRSVCDEALSLLDMLWQYELASKPHETPEQRAYLKATLEKRIAAIVDEDVKAFYKDALTEKIKTELFHTTDNIFSDVEGLNKTPYTQAPLKRLIQKANIPLAKQREKTAHSAYRPQAYSARMIRKPLDIQKYTHQGLLAAILHYPELYADFCEELGLMALPDPELERFRLDLIDILKINYHLRSPALIENMSRMGHGQTLALLSEPILYSYAEFAKKDQILEDVRHGWIETWQRMFLKNRNL